MDKLTKRLQEAQNKVAELDRKAADVEARLEAAKAALASAETEYQACLAASVLDGNADTVRAKKALESAHEHVDKLTAALARLAREKQAALAEVHEAQKAVLAAEVAALDSEGAELYAQTVKSLTAIWKAAQASVDQGHLNAYDRAKSAGLSEGKAHVWRTLLAMSREVAHMLTVLERTAPEAYVQANGVTERERAEWIVGVETLAL